MPLKYTLNIGCSCSCIVIANTNRQDAADESILHDAGPLSGGSGHNNNSIYNSGGHHHSSGSLNANHHNRHSSSSSITPPPLDSAAAAASVDDVRPLSAGAGDKNGSTPTVSPHQTTPLSGSALVGVTTPPPPAPLGDNSLLVDISDALSEKDKVKFTVHTRTTLPGYAKPDFFVVRQHEEFVWLHDRFEENEEYGGYIVSGLRRPQLYLSLYQRFAFRFGCRFRRVRRDRTLMRLERNCSVSARVRAI